MKDFALIGAAGFVAPRHMKAISETGNNLRIATDPHDSVGQMDSYFQDCFFTPDYKEFLDELRRAKGGEADRIDYVSICTPNYLHYDHVCTALNNGIDAICEKPLVITPAHLNDLEELEAKTGKRVFSIFQLRLHPSIIALKEKYESQGKREKVDLTLTYMSRRGPWYHVSWKGNNGMSGGLPMNIGIHFFDTLIWLFGDVQHSEVHLANKQKAAGFLDLEWARVKWFLSIDFQDLPAITRQQGKSAFRSITLGGEELEFTDGFTDLHTESYIKILDGKGFGVNDARAAIELVDSIEKCEVKSNKANCHKLVK